MESSEHSNQDEKEIKPTIYEIIHEGILEKEGTFKNMTTSMVRQIVRHHLDIENKKLNEKSNVIDRLEAHVEHL